MNHQKILLMKKIVFFSLCLCIVCTTKAQFTTGQKLIGPSLNFNTRNTSEKNLNSSTVYDRKLNSTSIGLGFESLKFISSKKAKGWRVNYIYSSNKFTNEALNSSPLDIAKNNQTSHEIGVGYITRSFILLKPKFNFYYDIIVYGGYQFGKSLNQHTITPSSYYNTTNNGYNANAFITPGFTYQLKKNLLVDASLNSIGSISYFNRKETSDDLMFNNYERKNSGFSATSSLSAGALLSNFWFSVKWIIDPKK